ncbi:MAG: helix-turn-helix transcriptional regulator [Clostridiales bacterium]|nr:helix-turn-helix transcriptional regulator [Clostridiales bacterium]
MKKQMDISQALGIDRSAYSYYEVGRSHPRISLIVQIAWLYQVRVHDLFGVRHPLPHDPYGAFSLENLQKAPELNLPVHLRGWRLYHNQRQRQIAEQLSLDRSTYAYYELGKSEPALTTIVRLAQFYDITIDQLFGLIPEL